jgi:peptidoglycan-N-acetylglucosamine deacetylase
MAPLVMARWRRACRGVGARVRGRLAGTLVSVAVRSPLVALTFDDGPDPATTPLVLDLLNRHRARATFFMVGSAARRHPDLVARVAGEGHAVGHHTLDHVSLVGLDRTAVRAQVAGGFAAVGPHAGRWFRPPFGHLDRLVWREARREGHEVVAWSGHALDWVPQDAASLATRLRAAVQPGAIVLLHDAPQPGDPAGAPRRALLEALDLELTGSPWTFVTVPELMAAGRPRRRLRWRSPG